MDTHFLQPRQSRPPLFGGLGLLPFALYLFLSAWAFERGWLDWETNHGPPFLGSVAALGLCKLIQRFYYGRILGFSFEPDRQPHRAQAKSRGIWTVVAILPLALLLGAWFVDANYMLPVRLLPLVLGVALVCYGFACFRHTWEALQRAYSLAGATLAGYSFLPLWLGASWGRKYFGVEGMFELLAGGIAATIIAVGEHQAILRIVELGSQADGPRSRYGPEAL